MSAEPDWGAELQRGLAQENPEAVTVVFLPAGWEDDREKKREAREAAKAEDRDIRDRILSRRPPGSVSADWQGRIAQHPMAAKTYLRWTRTCLDHLRSDPRATVSITVGHPKNAAQFRAEWWEVMDRRINAAGGVVVREPGDGEVALRRDQRAIHDRLQQRTRFYHVNSRIVRKRLPEMVEVAGQPWQDH